MRLTRAWDGEWLLYDDSLGMPQRAARFAATPLELPRDLHLRYLKQRAVESYESLQRGFSRAGRDLRSCLEIPEKYWRLPQIR